MSGRLDDYPYDVAELVRKAELDYLTVQRLDLPILAEIVCFHCQQCAEKYLKALISYHGQVPERTHDLVVLHARAAGHLPSADDLLPQLAFLSPFAVDVRYVEGSANAEMAAQATAAMECVRQAVRSALGLEEPQVETDDEPANAPANDQPDDTTGE